jgi:hypothetical protein
MHNQTNNNQGSPLGVNSISENNENVKQGNQKKIKQILIFAGVISAVVFLIMLVYLLYVSRGTMPSEFDPGTASQSSSTQCQEGDSCCHQSLGIICKGRYQMVQSDEKCPSGFKKNGLRCESSLTWCEPIENGRSMTVGDIKYPGYDKGIAIKININDEGLEMLDEYKVVNGYPNYYPGTYEFIAELIDTDNNILGEYGFRDPRLIQAEMGYDGPSSVESIDFTLIVPYFESVSKIKIYQKGGLKLTLYIVSNDSSVNNINKIGHQ